MKTRFYILFAISAVFLAAVFAGVAAQGLENVQFPLAELGNCKDQADCKAYCDKPANEEPCMAFARKNKLMSEQEIAVAEKFIKGDINGPGGCTTKDECEEYCNDMSHIDECVAFAEKSNLIPPAELEEAKKVQAAMKRGVKPPPCGNKKACDSYCNSSDHMEECITFATEAGFMQGKELEDAQKMLQAVKRGVKPPPCNGKDDCDAYCTKPENMETCMNFAMEAGMMSEEEKEGAQKTLQAIKKGVKPPPCRGKEECDAYCQQDEHIEECINFSVAAGMMNEKDAEMAKKTRGKGPGGCISREECDAFCKDPNNQETCFNFGRENGLIPEEDLKRMEEGKQQTTRALNNAPAETIECLNQNLGSDLVEKMKSGNAMMGPEIGDKMQACFMKNERGMQNSPPCKSPEECDEFCKNNPDQCENGAPRFNEGNGEGPQDFRPGPGEQNPGGQMMPQQAGPGGCKGPEECQKYCEANPDNCKNFQQPQNGPMPQGQMMPPCQGENCGPKPPEGEQFIQRQEGMMPPEGQNLQRPEGQMPAGDFRPPEGEQFIQRQEGMMPPEGQNLQPNQQMPPQDQQAPLQQIQQQPPPEQPAPAPGPGPEPAPEPSPLSSVINTDSLVGSLLDAAFRLVFTRR